MPVLSPFPAVSASRHTLLQVFPRSGSITNPLLYPAPRPVLLAVLPRCRPQAPPHEPKKKKGTARGTLSARGTTTSGKIDPRPVLCTGPKNLHLPGLFPLGITLHFPQLASEKKAACASRCVRKFSFSFLFPPFWGSSCQSSFGSVGNLQHQAELTCSR